MRNPEQDPDDLDEDDGIDDEDDEDSGLVLPPIFPPGTSPERPPEEALGRTGEQRWEGGLPLVVRPSGGPGEPVLADPVLEKPRWVPRGPQFKPALHTVQELKRGTWEWTVAKMFVSSHHYLGSLPNVQRSIFHALYREGQGLVGVAIYSMPGGKTVKVGGKSHPLSILNVFPGGTDEALELSRFILLPHVEYGGESWFLARSRELLLLAGLRGFTSFSDPHQWVRMGVVVKPGHYGQIYQATNLAYLGKTAPSVMYFTPDFRILVPQGLSKIRTGKSGWVNQVRRLVRDFGASAPASFDKAVRERMALTGEKYDEALRKIKKAKHDRDELVLWLDRALTRIRARKILTPGKHKFAFLVDPAKADKELRRIRRSVYYRPWLTTRSWSPDPVKLPYPEGRDVWPVSGRKPADVARYGEEYPQKPDSPETGEILERNAPVHARERNGRPMCGADSGHTVVVRNDIDKAWDRVNCYDCLGKC